MSGRRFLMNNASVCVPKCIPPTLKAFRHSWTSRIKSEIYKMKREKYRERRETDQRDFDGQSNKPTTISKDQRIKSGSVALLWTKVRDNLQRRKRRKKFLTKSRGNCAEESWVERVGEVAEREVLSEVFFINIQDRRKLRKLFQMQLLFLLRSERF